MHMITVKWGSNRSKIAEYRSCFQVHVQEDQPKI